jgi:signal peptidase I
VLKPVRLAFIITLVLGLLGLLGGISNPLSLLTAFIYLAAAAGLWRGTVWCGFGLALWTAAQVVLAIELVWYWRQLGATDLVAVAVSIAIYLPASWIFYRAGKALVAAGSPRSFAAPWIALTTLTLAIGVMFLFVRPYVIPTGAMEDTILIGDHLLVPRAGAHVPHRGDIVVFPYPVDRTQTFVKRVIGMPGDRVRIVNKEVYLNGKAVTEPYAYHKSSYTDSYRDNFPSDPNISVDQRATEMLREHVINGEVEVPPNNYFVLGDNRDSSLDSRYWGFVPAEDIIGKPWIIYWSVASPAQTLSGPSSAWGSLGRIRWSRISTVIHGDPI